jgi:hypothetical protein
MSVSAFWKEFIPRTQKALPTEQEAQESNATSLSHGLPGSGQSEST